MTTDNPTLQVETLVHNSQDPVLVHIGTEGVGGLRVTLNGNVVFDGEIASEA